MPYFDPNGLALTAGLKKGMKNYALYLLCKVHSIDSNIAVTLIQQSFISGYHIAVCYNKSFINQCIEKH